MRQGWAGAATFLTALAWVGAATAADDPPPPSYTKDVKPFMTTYCISCHNARRPRAGVSVETFADLTKAGRRGALVVPEKPEDSRLLSVLAGKGKPMPPRKAPQPTVEEIGKVHDWIKAGAADDTPAANDQKTSEADKAKPAGDSGK
jgi:mono/diheme cytochrome c family protein